MAEGLPGPIKTGTLPGNSDEAALNSLYTQPAPPTGSDESATIADMNADLRNPIDAIPPGDDDDFMSDEGYGSSEAGSFMSSILSSVRRGVQENGRLYPSFGKYKYGIPIDERELDRNDFQHHKFSLLLQGKLYLAPIPDTQLSQPNSRILDLGTGTGVWAVEMADKFPNTEVIGNDIAATQPPFVPPNCIFEIEDVEDDWPYPPQHFDFIHGREFLFSIRNWSRLISQAHNALRPGGWLQLACTIPDVQCDDHTMSPKAAIKEAGDIFLEMGVQMGAPPTAARQWKEQLTAAGFVNVEQVVLKIPTSPWPKDSRLRTVGAIERAMLSDGLETMMLRGWTQLLGRRQEDLTVFCEHVAKELRDTGIHVYCDWHIVTRSKYISHATYTDKPPQGRSLTSVPGFLEVDAFSSPCRGLVSEVSIGIYAKQYLAKSDDYWRANIYLKHTNRHLVATMRPQYLYGEQDGI